MGAFGVIWMVDPTTLQILALRSEVLRDTTGRRRPGEIDQEWVFEDVRIVPTPPD